MSNVKTAYERGSYKIRWVFLMQFSSIFQSRCVQRLNVYTVLIFSLSESPWSEYTLCPSWVNVLISPHVSTPVQPFFMQPYRGKRPFDCPVAGNAPLSRVLYSFPFQFLTTFLGCKVFHSYFLQSGAFKEVRMSGLTNKCNYPGACRIIDAYFRLNLAWWVWFYCLVFNLLAFS